jgi:hypothetical protein
MILGLLGHRSQFLVQVSRIRQDIISAREKVMFWMGSINMTKVLWMVRFLVTCCMLVMKIMMMMMLWVIVMVLLCLSHI